MENPSFIRDFPLPECISPCEQPSSVPMFREFRANCIHEQQLWHGMVHLLKAYENQASGARQSPAASDTVGLEPKKLAGHPSKQAAQEMHDVVPSPHPLPAPRKHSCLTHLHSKISTQPPAASSQLAGAAGAFRFGVYAATLILHGVQLLRRHWATSFLPAEFDPFLYAGSPIPGYPSLTYLLAPSWCWSARPCFHPGRACVENSTLSSLFCKDSWPLSSVHRC